MNESMKLREFCFHLRAKRKQEAKQNKAETEVQVRHFQHFLKRSKFSDFSFLNVNIDTDIDIDIDGENDC